MKRASLNRATFFGMILIFSICIPLRANDHGTGLYSWYNAYWGDQKIRDSVASCDTDALVTAVNNPPATYIPNGGIGIVNVPNLVFCMLEKNLNITGATEGATGHFTYGSDFYFHAKVEGSKGGGAQSDGQHSDSYDFRADVWGCRGDASACSTPAAFNKMMRVYWTQSGGDAVKKGRMFMDRTVMNGMTRGMAEYYVWDMGTTATKRALEIKQVCLAYCGSPTNWYGYHEVSGDAVKAAFFQVYPSRTSGTEFRFAAAFNLANNTAGAQRDDVTITTPRDDRKNDAVTWDYNHCLTRTPTADGEDWDYNGTLDCDPTLSMSYPGLSIKDVVNLSETNVNDGVLFGDMASHPDSI